MTFRASYPGSGAAIADLGESGLLLLLAQSGLSKTSTGLSALWDEADVRVPLGLPASVVNGPTRTLARSKSRGAAASGGSAMCHPTLEEASSSPCRFRAIQV